MTLEESVIWVLWFVLIMDVALLIVYFWVRFIQLCTNRGYSSNVIGKEEK